MQKKPHNPRYRGKHTTGVRKNFKRPVRLIQKGFKQPRKNFLFKLLRPIVSREQLHGNAQRARKALSVVSRVTSQEVRHLRLRAPLRALLPQTFPVSAGRKYVRIAHRALLRKKNSRVFRRAARTYTGAGSVVRFRTAFSAPAAGIRTRTALKKRQIMYTYRYVAGSSRLTPREQHLSKNAQRFKCGAYLTLRASTKNIPMASRLKLRFRAGRLGLGLTSRRRRGKRAYAGLVGKRRWRTERRDKFLLRRAIRRQYQQVAVLKAARALYRKEIASTLRQSQVTDAALTNTKNALPSRVRLRSRLLAVSTRRARHFFSIHAGSEEPVSSSVAGARLRAEHRRAITKSARVLPR